MSQRLLLFLVIALKLVHRFFIIKISCTVAYFSGRLSVVSCATTGFNRFICFIKLQQISVLFTRVHCFLYFDSNKEVRILRQRPIRHLTQSFSAHGISRMVNIKTQSCCCMNCVCSRMNYLNFTFLAIFMRRNLSCRFFNWYILVKNFCNINIRC